MGPFPLPLLASLLNFPFRSPHLDVQVDSWPLRRFVWR